MSAVPDNNARTESALYWSAVSLVVCEGLPLKEAAERLGVDNETLCSIVCRRHGPCVTPIDAPSPAANSAQEADEAPDADD